LGGVCGVHWRGCNQVGGRSYDRQRREESRECSAERLGYTVMFLRMTATEMHKLAEHNPEIARELRHMAEQVQGEADSLVGHIRERRQ